MFQPVIVSFFLAFTSAFVLEPHDGQKVIGGTEIGIEKVPYQIALEWKGEQYCGGSIITTKHILTAGHCVDLIDAADITVRYGATELQSGGTIVQVFKTTIHPNYTDFIFAYDVAVIELVEEIKLSNTSQIIPLADSEPAPGTYVAASGWGMTYLLGPPSETLLSTNMIVVDREVCKIIYEGYGIVNEQMFCAGDSRGTCIGDSGGPVTKQVDSGERLLAGIVSWGRNGCAEPNYPGVYTSVTHPDVKNFILETIKVE